MEKPTSKLFKDLTGQKFNRLLVKDYFGKKGNQPCWICICDCGNEKIIRSGDLKNGHAKSCGCLKKDKQKKKMIDLTEQVFEMYTVLEYAGEAWPENKRNRGHQWKCKCECGEERVVFGNRLMLKKDQSSK